MKPAPFALSIAGSLPDAGQKLAAGGTLIAGGQSLGAMLNFRVARPDRLIAIDRVAALRCIVEDRDSVTIGAAVTHGEIEDGAVPDIGQAVLPNVAAGIAYRAVRNRGTIGGSLCHGDPAADWPTALTALDAVVLTAGPGGERRIPINDFITGAFRTSLQPGELLQAVRIPRLSPRARWVYRKLCRKPGEFAHVMIALLIDPDRGRRRLVMGALAGPPLLFRDSFDDVAAALPSDDAALHQQQLVLLRRVLAEVGE
jgi:carbon-monoxide dehydrogenase medium subunit